MTNPRPAPSLLDTVVCARERLNDAQRVATYLKEELVREHRLRGVILGVQARENLGHALAYPDEPVLLTLTDILTDKRQYGLTERERKARPVVWSDLPCVKLVSRY